MINCNPSQINSFNYTCDKAMGKTWWRVWSCANCKQVAHYHMSLHVMPLDKALISYAQDQVYSSSCSFLFTLSNNYYTSLFQSVSRLSGMNWCSLWHYSSRVCNAIILTISDSIIILNFSRSSVEWTHENCALV